MTGSPTDLDAVHSRLGVPEGDAFLARLSAVGHDLREALQLVYGDRVDTVSLVDQLVTDALETAAARDDALVSLDRSREVEPRWFLSQEQIGYICYADRFAGDLRAVVDRMDHLAELGVRYLHLMPLLQPREGENDGGYAVADYGAVDRRLGSVADLRAVTASAHARGLAVCTDLVLNHTAREHSWAQAALAGDEHYRAFYRIFPDRTAPDEFEATLPEVFPDFAPGNFTRLPESGEWVWTTFNDYQWDLDWSNPDVFRAMYKVIGTLLNHGVDVIRLDAVPFLWKRKGTDCQNQPEAHWILQALKALTRLARPGALLKAEAIVGPDELVPYLGGHELFRPECDLAYDNQLMVMLWSSLATRDARLATAALRRRSPAPDGTAWVTYVRCHDDIGWAVADRDAWEVGTDPGAHRRFLAAFFAQRHPGSFATGLDFQVNEATGDARTSGTCAALAGLDSARRSGSADETTAALRRIELLHAVTYSFGGIPLIYMGDEIGLPNDDRWAAEPGHGGDNRWVHRPRLDWGTAERRSQPGTIEHRCFDALRRLGRARASIEAFRSDASTEVLPIANRHVLGYVRRHRRTRPVLCLACFSDRPEQVVLQDLLPGTEMPGVRLLHSTEGLAGIRDGVVHLPAWGFAWLIVPGA